MGKTAGEILNQRRVGQKDKIFTEKSEKGVKN